jgi:putative inorganic carbon (HCO3(-)) transporter
LPQSCKGFLKKCCATILFVKIFEKIIFWQFASLLFLVPLILWPFTSEVFEFNKMILVYILTTFITASWIIKMIYEKKFVFRRTILDIPLLVFLGSQLISTIFSIDPGTSWLGYYSRFNGGMLSVISYSLLYWAFVTNIDSKRTFKLINITLASAALVSIYGVLEHFGIDKAIWVQDVQSRVFSTLGQPNWLSAWLVALMPITWAFLVKSKIKSKSFWVYFLLSALYFWTLIFTKSRSGLLGFGVAFLVFWIICFWINRKELKKCLIPFIVTGFSLLTICLISGTQWTPSLNNLISKSANKQIPVVTPQGPALETGGTESGTIRKIVWKGAIQIWLHYPIFGTGVETFAYSYYMYRPIEHNLTSEWDFIYNKAHNEYLNFLANSGTVGLLSYLTLIVFSIILIFKSKLEQSEISNLRFALLAGYISLLVTNFFGFSVVPTQLQFFLFPAIAFAVLNDQQIISKDQLKKPDGTQKFFRLIVVGFVLMVMFAVGKYWYADYLYSSGRGYNSINKPDVASNYFTRAVNLEPNQAIYLSELAGSNAKLTLIFNQQKQTDQVTQFSNMAIAQAEKAVTLSPANVNLKRTKFGVYVMLSAINPNYLIDAKNTLEAAIIQAPTDAKILYNLGLVYARVGQMDLALSTLKKTIELKSNYKEARLAYAYVLIDKKENEAARNELNYILTNIDPNDSLTKQTLESIK